MNTVRHWIYEKQEIPSEKNGTIVRERFFGQEEVYVNGTGQTTRYTTRMWQKALRRIPKHAHIKRVLLLGLGAGGAIEKIHARFPGCTITAIEYDPAMIALAESLHLFKAKNRPVIIESDAKTAVPKLTEKFDLIVVDLFSGREPSPLVHDHEFMEQVRDKLHYRGYLLLNIFKKQEYLTLPDGLLSCWKTWRFRYNYLGLFRPFGNGKAGDSLPASYIDPRQYEPYLRSNFYHPKFPSFLIKKETYLGTQWHHGPLWFEDYATDQEPHTEPFPHARMVMWQPITRMDKPNGWHRFWLSASIKQTGFTEITDPDHYWAEWTEHAKRHRKKFLSHDTRDYVIEPATLAEYQEAYLKTHKYGSLKKLFIDQIQRKIDIHGANMNVWVVRTRADKKIVAGLATLDMPEINQSIHVAAFITHAGEKTSVGTGIIDHWFLHCVKRGIRVLNFGTFRTFGEPRSWKGFTRFKSQFGIRYVKFPMPLFRWIKKNT